MTQVNIEKLKKLEDAPQRVIFPSLDDSLEYVGKLSELIAGSDVQLSIYSLTIDENGDAAPNPDQAWPQGADGKPHEAMVAKLNRQEGPQGDRRNVTKAIIVHPVPTLDQLLADDSGREMVESVIEKELNHRTFRPIRTADNIKAMLAEMPVSIEQFTTSSRESTGGLLATFNELYKGILDFMRTKLDRVRRARLTKEELRKCLENAAYATHYYAPLEEAGDFETFLAAMNSIAERESMDTTLIAQWAAERKNQSFDADDEDGDTLDVADLMAGLTGDDSEEEGDE